MIEAARKPCSEYPQMIDVNQNSLARWCTISLRNVAVAAGGASASASHPSD